MWTRGRGKKTEKFADVLMYGPLFYDLVSCDLRTPRKRSEVGAIFENGQS